ncbi:MAG: hypothetical protein AVDCRST_MAG73-1035, partial [uncultured Thermomicrobiales bacterium]
RIGGDRPGAGDVGVRFRVVRPADRGRAGDGRCLRPSPRHRDGPGPGDAGGTKHGGTGDGGCPLHRGRDRRRSDHRRVRDPAIRRQRRHRRGDAAAGDGGGPLDRRSRSGPSDDRRAGDRAVRLRHHDQRPGDRGRAGRGDRDRERGLRRQRPGDGPGAVHRGGADRRGGDGERPQWRQRTGDGPGPSDRRPGDDRRPGCESGPHRGGAGDGGGAVGRGPDIGRGRLDPAGRRTVDRDGDLGGGGGESTHRRRPATERSGEPDRRRPGQPDRARGRRQRSGRDFRAVRRGVPGWHGDHGRVCAERDRRREHPCGGDQRDPSRGVWRVVSGEHRVFVLRQRLESRRSGGLHYVFERGLHHQRGAAGI